MISLPALQMTWYVLLHLLLAGFVVMGGTDLGAGLWYLCARRGVERDQVLQTVAPFWDGNQVWLIAAGGATFAAFPPVYAAVLSGLYPLLMLLLVALVLRTVAIDYAHQEGRPALRQAWDVTLGGSSIVAVLCLGLLIGNLLQGLPLDEQSEVVMSFGALFRPWALLVTAVAGLMIAVHGAIWLAHKTKGEVQERARRWGMTIGAPYFVVLLAALVVFALLQPRLAANYGSWPGLWALPVLALLAVIVAGAAQAGRRSLLALLSSSAGIVLVFATGGAAMYPRLAPDVTGGGLSLTAHNASASQTALLVMLGIMVVFLPLVLAYTSWLHWLFRQPAEREAQHQPAIPPRREFQTDCDSHRTR